MLRWEAQFKGRGAREEDDFARVLSSARAARAGRPRTRREACFVSCPVQAHVNRIVSKVNVYRAYIPRPRHRFPVNSAAIPARLSSFQHVPQGLAVPIITRTFEALRSRRRGLRFVESPSATIRKENPMRCSIHAPSSLPYGDPR